MPGGPGARSARPARPARPAARGAPAWAHRLGWDTSHAGRAQGLAAVLDILITETVSVTPE